MERRFFGVSDLRLEERAGAGDGKEDMPTVRGYAAVFNSLSQELWGFREMVAPGAFAESIGKDDIRALWCHERMYPLGRTVNGTLSLEEDETGLRVAFTPPATQYARDFVEAIQRGDVDQMSFGFATLIDDWTERDGGIVRVLRKVKLFEVSPEVFPAYTATSVGVRGLELGEKPKIPEHLVRAHGDAVDSAGLRLRAQAERQRELEMAGSR